MSSPVLPSEFKNVISDPTSSMCGNFINTLLRFPVLFYNWFSWAFNTAGDASNDFKREIRYTGDLIFSASPSAEDDSRLLCNGQEIVRADYPELFVAIGTNYGEGNTTTTFNVPDYRDKFLRGVGAKALGDLDGADTATLDLTNIPPHKHANPSDQDTIAVNKSGNGIGLDKTGGSAHVDSDWTAEAGGSGTPKVAQPFSIVPACQAVYIYIAT